MKKLLVQLVAICLLVTVSIGLGGSGTITDWFDTCWLGFRTCVNNPISWGQGVTSNMPICVENDGSIWCSDQDADFPQTLNARCRRR